jgi:hypothetical protein
VLSPYKDTVMVDEQQDNSWEWRNPGRLWAFRYRANVLTLSRPALPAL